TILERIGAIPLPMYSPDGAEGGAGDVDEGAGGDNGAGAGQGAEGDDNGAGADAGQGNDKGKTATALDGDEGGDGQAAHPADWPEDWREKMAGGDEEAQKAIKRYGDRK